jgi:hypothetical protein
VPVSSGTRLAGSGGPRHVLRRSDEWIFTPEAPYERQGDVNGVVFPCGWILDKASGAIRMYYGGADTCLALATAQLVRGAQLPAQLPCTPRAQAHEHDIVRLSITTLGSTESNSDKVRSGDPADTTSGGHVNVHQHPCQRVGMNA